jgi:DNA-binding NarL/FixJ family response regulator
MQSETPQLTARQLEVARLVGMGMRNREICKRLSVEPTTIRWHIGQIYRKLGIASRLQLVLFVVGSRWVSLAEVAAVVEPRLAIVAAANRALQ